MPEQSHSHTKLFLWLGFLIAFLIILSFAALFVSVPQRGQEEALVTSESIRLGEAPRPVFTDEVKERVRTSAGFQSLISYTDNGFEPRNVEIGAGQVVRFTNNSSQPLDLDFGGARVRVAVQDFYEHQYGVVGEWSYVAGGVGGVVRVR